MKAKNFTQESLERAKNYVTEELCNPYEVEVEVDVQEYDELVISTESFEITTSLDREEEGDYIHFNITDEDEMVDQYILDQMYDIRMHIDDIVKIVNGEEE